MIVKLVILACLQAIGPPPTFPIGELIHRLATDNDFSVRQQIFEQAPSEWTQVVHEFKKANGMLKSRILGAVYLNGFGSTDPTLLALAFASSDPSLRLQAIGDLQSPRETTSRPGASHSENYLEALRTVQQIAEKALVDKDASVRLKAAEVCRWIPWDPKLENRVVALRADSDYSVRTRALQTVVDKTKATPIGWFVEYLRYPPEDRTLRARSMPVYDLERAVAASVCEMEKPFEASLSQGPEYVRLRCMSILFRVPEPLRSQIAATRVHDEYWMLRSMAYGCLAHDRILANIPLLISGLDDPNSNVQWNASTFLTHGSLMDRTIWKEGAAALIKAKPDSPYTKLAESEIKRARH